MNNVRPLHRVILGGLMWWTILLVPQALLVSLMLWLFMGRPYWLIFVFSVVGVTVIEGAGFVAWIIRGQSQV